MRDRLVTLRGLLVLVGLYIVAVLILWKMSGTLFPYWGGGTLGSIPGEVAGVFCLVAGAVSFFVNPLSLQKHSRVPVWVRIVLIYVGLALTFSASGI